MNNSGRMTLRVSAEDTADFNGSVFRNTETKIEAVKWHNQ
ncbi:hypothetical protein FRUB_09521 [Fimbriiglobus ruber]|uniref:Uncharacterized protein n=1 Tax=Fimbriiglobus ruber TaxID=1908690 RepID=A0A225DC07_9BACT|nr:hypothetical protein FRUB_09521 [Fimbriiglobus ruber]